MFPNQLHLTHLLSSLLIYFPQAYHLVGKNIYSIFRPFHNHKLSPFHFVGPFTISQM